MIKIGFCDDELSVLEEIRGLLDRYRMERNLEIAAVAFQSPMELLSELEKGMRFDILLMDVLMPKEDGIEAAKKIRRIDSNVKIVFLTFSSEYAVESYTVGAYFYQLKPILEEKFFHLMDSVIAACKKEKHHSLILHGKSGITRLDLERLEYCEVLGRTLWFHMKNGTILESVGSMEQLCRQLAAHRNFLRPHRSYLVNLEYVQNISPKMITMENLAEIPVPHGKYSDLKNRYLEYAFHKKQVFLT